MFDAIQTARQRRGKDQVEIGIGARDAVLDTNGTPSIVDDTDRAGTIIHTPGSVERRPCTLDVALVGVDYRGIQNHKFRQFVQHACQELAHSRRHMPFGLLIPEDIVFLVAIPQAHV